METSFKRQPVGDKGSLFDRDGTKNVKKPFSVKVAIAYFRLVTKALRKSAIEIAKLHDEDFLLPTLAARALVVELIY
jgi:hypothetical protein